MGRPKSKSRFQIFARGPIWYVTYWEDGKRIQRSTGYKRADYSKKQMQKIIDSELGTKNTSEYTIDWFIDHLMYKLEIDGMTKNTRVARRAALEHLKAIYGSEYSVLRIEREAIDLVKAYLYEKHCSPTTINTYLKELRAAFERLFIDGKISKNPFYKYPKVKVPRAKKKHLTLSESRDFINYVKKNAGEDLFRLIKIYLFTGRRRNEILFLKHEQVDLDKGIFRHVNIKSHDKHEVTRKIPKSVYDDFRYFIKKRRKSDYPFRVHKCPDTITHKVSDLLTEAGFPELSLHSLRHTHVTLGLENKQNIREMQKSLDHSTVSVTEGYAHDEVEEIPEIGLESFVDSFVDSTKK